MIGITLDDIREALKFYEIDDETYYDRCVQCVDYLNKNDLMLRFYMILAPLYNDDLSNMWKIKSISDLLECDDLWVTNIILLMGYKLHLINMKKHLFDEEQIRIHKLRVRECLTNDIWKRKLDGIRFSQLLWGLYFVRIKVVEVGRLQYGLSNGNIKIHIYGGSKLNFDEVEDSLRKSKSYIKKYFGIDKYDYLCNSWLLSKEVLKLVDKNSNIASFQSLFEITEGEECLEDILNFVYGISEIDDYNNLSEETSLQREIKKELLNGKVFHLGCGKLKEMSVD